MKTLAEACKATFVYDLPSDAGPIEAQVVMKTVASDVDKWKAIDEEVRACRWVKVYIAQMILLRNAGVFSLGEALMACFIQAVQVGIEMERAELSEQTLKSEVNNPKGDPHQ